MIELVRPQLASSEIPDIYTQVTYPKYLQPKLDGICCLAVNGVAMSRNMKPIPNKFIQKYFADNKLHGFHGELMIAGDFNDVQSGVMRIEGEPDFYYTVYDYWDSDKGYRDRLSLIMDLDDQNIDLVRVELINTDIVNSPEECDFVLQQAVKDGYEGGMLRDPDSLYKQGRHTLKSQALMKLKSFSDDEAVIIGYEEKMHNTNEKETNELGLSKRSSKKEGMVPANTLGALVVKWRDVEFKIGSGYTDAQRQELWNKRESLIGKLTTYKYQELSKYGVPRFPVWKALREEFM
jgi:DNA ligase 1